MEANVESASILFHKHVSPCYSLDALLVNVVVSEMPKYSARQALLWQLIAKNRKRRLSFEDTEQLLQIDNSHLKHLYLVSMK